VQTLAWLRKQRPDVIVAYHWKMIVPLRKAGFRIPEELPLAAVLSNTQRLLGYPLISGCDIQIQNMTRESLIILRDLIGWGKRELSRQSMEHVFEPVWIEGETLGRRGGRRKWESGNRRRGERAEIPPRVGCCAISPGRRAHKPDWGPRDKSSRICPWTAWLIPR
jgi:hypothetical protein